MTPGRTAWREVVVVAVLCIPASAQSTSRVSVASSGAQGNDDSSYSSISADGRVVVFSSSATNLIPGGTIHSLNVFFHDRSTSTTGLASVDSNDMEGNGLSSQPSISADGRYVVFSSNSSNLVPGDTNASVDVFVHDIQTGSTRRVSVNSNGREGNGPSGASSLVPPTISGDGRFVAFDSYASNLVPGDTNGAIDVFVHDRQTGENVRVSVDSNGAQANGPSYIPSISADGRVVVFLSGATNLVPGDTNGQNDLFVHDLQTGQTARVNVDSNGAQSSGITSIPYVSADGRHVVFQSYASDLVAGDTNGVSDVFVRDLQTGETTRVSVATNGAQGDGDSDSPSVSVDGRFVAFRSTATNLVSNDSNAVFDVFLHDRSTGTTALLRLDSSGAQANGGSFYPSISADGRFVAFDSYASNLAPADNNLATDVFVRDRGAASAFVALCFGDGTSAACPCTNNGAVNHGCENSAGTGGARLVAAGVASLSVDRVRLTCSGELPTALSIVLQGDVVIAPASFGDGMRCAGGNLKRLYSKVASSGTVDAPQSGDLPISVRSAALGAAIPLGATRVYQVYYRDGSSAFCPPPSGGTFNVSNAIGIAWGT